MDGFADGLKVGVLVGLEGFGVGVLVGLVGENDMDGAGEGGSTNHGDTVGSSVGVLVVGYAVVGDTVGC